MAHALPQMLQLIRVTGRGAVAHERDGMPR